MQSLLQHLPNCKVYSTTRQDDDEAEWLKNRTRGIGGSDVGPICGVSPFSSARQIYFNKTKQYDELTNNFSDAAKDRMRFGHLLEPIVADEFAHRMNKKVIMVHATLVHKDYSWALANVDRLIVDDNGCPYGVLECKTSSEFMNSEWDDGEIMLTYIYQLNWYLWITGLTYGAFACLVGGNKFYIYEVFRNDELLNETIIPKATSFWYDNVLALKEPELQATDSDLVNDLFKTVVKNSEISLPDDTDNELARTIYECKAKIKELEETMETAQNRLKEKLKDTEIGYTSDFTVKWSPRTQQRVDNDKLKGQFPEIYQQVLKKIEYRVFTVKGVKV